MNIIVSFSKPIKGLETHGQDVSAVWQYFSFPKRVAAPKQAVCKVLVNGNECGRQLSKQPAWNAKRHLRDIHGIDLFTVDEERRQTAPTKISRLKLAVRKAREEVDSTF